MLHGGLSLAIFEEWCTSEQNMIIMPGYCVAGTVGHKILNGTRKIDFKKGKPPVDVKMSVQYMSFSAHADAKGNNFDKSFFYRFLVKNVMFFV